MIEALVRNPRLLYIAVALLVALGLSSLAALPRLERKPDAARRLAKLREAALADDSGGKLKAAIAEADGRP